MHMELTPNYSAETALSYGCKRNDVMRCNQCVVGMCIRSHYSGISMIRGYWYLHFLHDKGNTILKNARFSGKGRQLFIINSYMNVMIIHKC